jgi:hypothetical protein
MKKLYIKSMDGLNWYVGDEPCKAERGIGFQLGRYYYAATSWTANKNLDAARAYARARAADGSHEIADYGFGDPVPDSVG